jgi:thiamine pyrophosphate-dependent acetolactate synthase large subunit-like protein
MTTERRRPAPVIAKAAADPGHEGLVGNLPSGQTHFAVVPWPRAGRGGWRMHAGAAIAEILKREGVEIVFGYPVNHVLEYAARAEIRPVIVRQERIGVHMADAYSRLSSGEKIGVFCMQHGPGTENAYGGVAQAYGESVPVLIMPMGYARRLAHSHPNYNATREMRGITKSAEPITSAAELAHVMRRAFTRLRSGRGGPVLVEIPVDLFTEEVPAPDGYVPTRRLRSGPDPEAVRAVARHLVEAERLVIYAGQGVHYAKAWPELKRLAELLAAPVCTSLGGKSAFPEDHPLALGSGGVAMPKPVRHFLDQADLIFGIGCSFTTTSFGVAMPKGARIIHSTLDPVDVNKDVVAEMALLGDAKLVLAALIDELEPQVADPPDLEPVRQGIEAVRQPWLDQWRPKLTSDETPLSPYRVLWDLAHTVDRANTIITHDAGSPRDQLSPFWISSEPLTYLGWGKTTQLGYGLGLAMGAKLARPDSLCINVWGDAAIGFTGMDLETAVRERIPILSILLNNFCMAIELKVMPVSTERYRATDISGDYAAMMRAFGGYGLRVTTPDEIVPAIKRGIEATERGQPALLEFITAKEVEVSKFA